MSSRVTIEPTKFENVRSGIVSYGVRVYDDYAQTYDNTWESIPEDDMALLKQLMDSDDKIIQGILGFVQEHEKGVEVGGAFYDWDDIKQIFEK